MCSYRCVLCGYVYSVEKQRSASSAGDDDFPDWSPSENVCPVCSGLALPCGHAGCATIADQDWQNPEGRARV
ncbi:MAG TPA: hypothetical protein VMU02_11900 [bacterium]|nr:hypothetical protein [bacterium]